MKHVDIYTDGACSSNPGPGGWAAVLIYNGYEKRISGFQSHTTNNIMELTAAIEALSCLKYSCGVTIYSDSKYVVDAISKGWVIDWKKRGWRTSKGTPAKNVELWKKLLALNSSHEVNYVWIKGHNGNKYNEICDAMALSQINNNS